MYVYIYYIRREGLWYIGRDFFVHREGLLRNPIATSGLTRLITHQAVNSDIAQPATAILQRTRTMNQAPVVTFAVRLCEMFNLESRRYVPKCQLRHFGWPDLFVQTTGYEEVFRVCVRGITTFSRLIPFFLVGIYSYQFAPSWFRVSFSRVLSEGTGHSSVDECIYLYMKIRSPNSLFFVYVTPHWSGLLRS